MRRGCRRWPRARPLTKERIEASQHFTEPPPRYTEATLVKKMEELGIGRPSTYASILAVLHDRDYVRIDKKRLIPEDKGRLVTAFLEAFFAHYVEYDFTAELEEKLDEISNGEIDWKAVLRDFWDDFSQALAGTKDLRTTQVLDSLNALLGAHIFPARADGGDPRQCPLCGKGQLSLKLGKFGAFIGCSNYPECRFTRVLSPTGQDGGDGERPGVRALGLDPASGQEVTLRSGRFGDYVQLGEGEKPKRCSLPRGLAPDDVTLEKAVALLSLPREVARHPSDGEPILAGVGRYGAYVQHGKTYANLGRDDDVLTIGANRAIDLIAAKESGAGSRFGGNSGRALGEHPTLGGRGRGAPRPLRRLCQSRQGQRDPAARNQPGSGDAGGGAGDARRQGLRRPRRTRDRRAPRRRADHAARRPLRRLRQLGQGQRDHPQVDAAELDHARRGARTHRRARGTAGRRGPRRRRRNPPPRPRNPPRRRRPPPGPRRRTRPRPRNRRPRKRRRKKRRQRASAAPERTVSRSWAWKGPPRLARDTRLS